MGLIELWAFVSKCLANILVFGNFRPIYQGVQMFALSTVLPLLIQVFEIRVPGITTPSTEEWDSGGSRRSGARHYRSIFWETIFRSSPCKTSQVLEAA